MEKIIVNVAWCDKNFGGSLGSNVPGAVVFTAPTFEALQKEAKDSLEFHVEGLLENGFRAHEPGQASARLIIMPCFVASSCVSERPGNRRLPNHYIMPIVRATTVSIILTRQTRCSVWMLRIVSKKAPHAPCAFGHRTMLKTLRKDN